MHSLLSIVLEKAFQKNFSDATVQVVDCPDLREAPFHLAAPGELFNNL